MIRSKIAHESTLWDAPHNTQPRVRRDCQKVPADVHLWIARQKRAHRRTKPHPRGYPSCRRQPAASGVHPSTRSTEQTGCAGLRPKQTSTSSYTKRRPPRTAASSCCYTVRRLLESLLVPEATGDIASELEAPRTVAWLDDLQKVFRCRPQRQLADLPPVARL